MDQEVEVTIRLAESERDRAHAILSKLEQAGLKDAVLLPRFMTVNGRVPRGGQIGLREIPGVESVRESGSFKTA